MIAKLEHAQIEISQGMRDFADRMDEVSAMIRRGEIRAASMCYVESGPDMMVSREWSSMTGRITMIGGLHQLMDDISRS